TVCVPDAAARRWLAGLRGGGERSAAAALVCRHEPPRGRRPVFPLCRQQPRQHGGPPQLPDPDRTLDNPERSKRLVAGRLRRVSAARRAVRCAALAIASVVPPTPRT